mmetsp:Transcript_3262/g.11781  ORF Transcript_3262/g.11781 Transcript_3262/m.11781 type:complete len:224 (+) Transcript_3262:1674-2345(+)
MLNPTNQNGTLNVANSGLAANALYVHVPVIENQSAVNPKSATRDPNAFVVPTYTSNAGVDSEYAVAALTSRIVTRDDPAGARSSRASPNSPIVGTRGEPAAPAARPGARGPAPTLALKATDTNTASAATFTGAYAPNALANHPRGRPPASAPSRFSRAGGGTRLDVHPLGVASSCASNHAATSRRLSQFVYTARDSSRSFVSGSRAAFVGADARQKRSSASRS